MTAPSTPRPPRTPGVFNPDAVGHVRGYPPTAEAYEARRAHLAFYRGAARAAGRLKRTNVPNGWAGRKPEIEAHRRNAERLGERLASEFLPEIAAAFSDEALGKLAVSFSLSVALDPSVAMRHRISAARVVLPFLLPKPSAKTILTEWTGGGVAFLAGLAASLDAQP